MHVLLQRNENEENWVTNTLVTESENNYGLYCHQQDMFRLLASKGKDRVSKRVVRRMFNRYYTYGYRCHGVVAAHYEEGIPYSQISKAINWDYITDLVNIDYDEYRQRLAKGECV